MADPVAWRVVVGMSDDSRDRPGDPITGGRDTEGNADRTRSRGPQHDPEELESGFDIPETEDDPDGADAEGG